MSRRTGKRIKTASLGAPAAGANNAVHAAMTGGAQDVTTAITNPAVPRNITATAGGTAGDIKAVQVTVHGTNAKGKAISETLPAFTADTPGTVTGSKAFATITRIVVPAHDAAGATTAIGTGNKLGLGDCLSRDTIVAAFLGGVREATRPTVAFDSDEVEKNTVQLNTALNGNAVIVDYYGSGPAPDGS